MNASPIYFSHELRQLEQCARESGITDLMEKAGLAAAELARELMAGKASVLILAGPGNNGGDALVAARHLKAWWFKVTLVFTGDAAKLPPDATHALQVWREAGGALLDAIPPGGKWDMIIDGLFGIGLARNLEGRPLELVRQVNAMNLPVLALDVPSGLDADAGQTFRAAIRATHTLTFIALKPGLLTAYGPDYCGKIHVDTLGLDAPALLKPSGWLLEKDALAAALKPRPRNSHKGLLGSVGILGGAPSMCGAALLAGRAALKLGAGRVYVALLAGDAPAVDMAQPELMLCSPQRLFELDDLNCLVVGPGLGQSAQAVQLLKQALDTELPLVLDADALNLIATDGELQAQLKNRKGGTILTPHSAEAARLTGGSTHDIQQERVPSAVMLAKRFNSLVVLKGAGSVCALPDEKWFINPTGNPGLSSAGMGDVLSGMIAALVAQRLAPQQALLLAVYLHGAAADELVVEGIGPIGLTATEVTDRARSLLNDWIYSEKSS
ncbi:MAG: NAD(P)H-hydrate dehydratase [Betaproteobacteria bacterium]|nr:NAD(P)H-hydrate dehydratase [Betaproteobacteria bacterium]